MEAILERVGMSMADFLEQSAAQPFELIYGEKRVKMPTVYGHARLIHLLLRLLEARAKENKSGRVLAETTFILPDSIASNWVQGSRTPDLMFFTGNRIEQYEQATANADELPLALVPDFVIEVISPTDKFTEVMDKIDLYLQDGVQLVWAVDMKRKKVTVYTPDGDLSQTFEGDEVLDVSDVVPDFRIKVSELFA
jgi:Uma2 family endonuclease